MCYVDANFLLLLLLVMICSADYILFHIVVCFSIGHRRINIVLD
jgi:hypothetical protein